MKSFDIIAVGELLIDMTPVKVDGRLHFQANPGGAPCNFLAMAQLMGAKTAFIGKVGDDAFGKQLKVTVENVGIDTSNLMLDASKATTLAIVNLDEFGNRSFGFYRKGCADVSLRTDEINFELLDQTTAVYFGSLAFTDEPIRSAVVALLSKAVEKKRLICYDPNYRPLLWDSQEQAVKAMIGGLKYADILKVSDEEALLLSGASTLEEAATILAAEGIQLVCITMGEMGTLVAFKTDVFHVPAIETKVVDTTGAGDAFFGALVQQITCCGRHLQDLSVDDMKRMVLTANVAGGICVQNYGAIPALPNREKVLAVLAEQV